MTILGSLLEKRAVNSGGIDPNTVLWDAITGTDGPPPHSGVTVNTTTAMRVIAVYACVKLIAETVAALPIKVYNRDDDTRAEIRRPGESYVWDRPNDEMTRQFFWETVLGHALLTGNAYIRTLRAGSGKIAELWPLNPNAVTPRRQGAEKIYEFNGERLTNLDIVHIPGYSFDGLKGLSPIGLAREGIGLAIATEEFGSRFFGQGSQPSGVLTTDGELTNDQATKIATRWQQTHSGLFRSHRIAVLENGLKWQQVSIPPNDAQFLETRRFQIAEIARLFRVPPHLISDLERSTSWGTGIEQQNVQFVTFTLLPWLTRLEAAITAYLLPAQDRYAKFSVDSLVRADLKTRYLSFQQGRFGGWLSANDIRALEDMPPIPGGDTYLVPGAVGPLGRPTGPDQQLPQPGDDVQPDPSDPTGGTPA